MTVEIVVGGRVQGVGFRAFVRSHARRLGIHGSAENLPDGRVRIVAEGSDEAVRELTRQVAIGPGLAQVSEVTSTVLPGMVGADPGFRIG